MVTTAIGTTQYLAFAHWKYNANGMAYSAKLIIKAMYEYARDVNYMKAFKACLHYATIISKYDKGRCP